MTTNLLDVSTAADVAGAVDRLSQTIAEVAPTIERDRELTPALLDELGRAGCHRLIVPESHGGLEADLVTAIDVWRRLATADASVAWTVMIGGVSWCDLAGLPRASFDDLFATGGDTTFAGAFNPTGMIDRRGDGYVVTGRWAFASGCRHAMWIFGNCVEPSAGPEMALRIAVFEPSDVVIEDTWTTLGLRGTGSHHFHVDDQPVAAEWTLNPMAEEPCIDTPVVHIPVPQLASLAVAGIALGIGQGAVHDIAAIAAGKVPLLSAGPLATDATFQFDLATADTGLRAANALMVETAEETWDAGVQGQPLTPELRARVRSAANWIVERAVAAVDAAQRSAGSSSVYAGSALERRFRDIHTLTQHFIVRKDATTIAGAVRAGLPLEAMIY
jgi:alkylation response protein AidB-like acyl-CoA dehydrogenase